STRMIVRNRTIMMRSLSTRVHSFVARAPRSSNVVSQVLLSTLLYSHVEFAVCSLPSLSNFRIVKLGYPIAGVAGSSLWYLAASFQTFLVVLPRGSHPFPS